MAFTFKDHGSYEVMIVALTQVISLQGIYQFTTAEGIDGKNL